MDNPDYRGSFALDPRLEESEERTWGAQLHNSKAPLPSWAQPRTPGNGMKDSENIPSEDS